jgi:hypothetical protein
MSKRKVYRPQDPARVLLRTMPWRVHAMMEPLELIVAQLEQDQSADVTAEGRPIFRDHANRDRWYETPIALVGVCEAFELHNERSGETLDTEPLRRLAGKLDFGQDIVPQDLRDARTCLNAIRSHCLRMTAGYAEDLLRTVRLREEMERLCLT